MWPRSFAVFRNSSQAAREFPIAAPIPTVQCSLMPCGEPAKMKIVAIRVLRVAPALGIEPDFVAQIFEVRGDQRQGIFRGRSDLATPPPGPVSCGASATFDPTRDGQVTTGRA